MSACKNFEICGERQLPQWWFDRKGQWLCTNCHMFFGTWGCTNCPMFFGTWGQCDGSGELVMADDTACEVCERTRRGFAYPRCGHECCVECFARQARGRDPPDDEPRCPYPDLEDELLERYDRDGADDPVWSSRYPLFPSWVLGSRDWWDRKEALEGDMNCAVCR